MMERAFDEASVGMAFLSMDGRYMRVNRALSGILGFSREELLGTSFLDVTASPLARSEENLRRLREDPSFRLRQDKTYRRKDGSTTDVHVTATSCGGGEPCIFVQVEDVSGRREAERMLRKRSTELSTLIGNLHGMVYRCSMDDMWSMQYVSEPCEHITGYRPEHLLGPGAMPFSELIHPDDLQRVRSSISQAVSEGRGFSLRYRLVRADGELRWVIEQGSAVRHEGEDVPHLEGYIADITEHVELGELFRRFFEDFPHGLAELAEDMRPLAVNEAFSSMMGLPVIEGGPIPPMPADSGLDALVGESLGSGRTVRSEIRRRGRIYSATVIPQPSSRQRAAHVLLQDVTELREGEEALAREEARLRLFLNSLDLFAYVKSPDQRYSMVNSSYARFLGLPEDGIIGRRHEELGTPMSMGGNSESDLEVIESGAPRVFEARMHGRVLMMRKFPIELREGQVGVGALISDISARRSMEDSDQFLHHLLSHDLRNKLTVVLGYRDLLDAQSQGRPGRFLDSMGKACQEGLELIEKVEVLKRLRSTGETEGTNLLGVLSRAGDLMQQRVEDAGMSLELDPGSLDVLVQAGPLLHELFGNLLENSVNHSGGSRIMVSARREGGRVVCRLEDDGAGMGAEDLEMLFERGFRRGDKAGSGLGTYLARCIADLYQADVEAGVSDLGGLRIDISLRPA